MLRAQLPAIFEEKDIMVRCSPDDPCGRATERRWVACSRYRLCSANSTSMGVGASPPPSARAVRVLATYCACPDHRAQPRVCAAIEAFGSTPIWTEAVASLYLLVLTSVVPLLYQRAALQNMGIEASEMPAISEPSYTGEAFLALACVAITHLVHGTSVSRSMSCGRWPLGSS